MIKGLARLAVFVAVLLFVLLSVLPPAAAGTQAQSAIMKPSGSSVTAVPPENHSIFIDLFANETAAGTSNVIGQITDRYLDGQGRELSRAMEKVEKFTRKYSNRANARHYDDLTRSSLAADRIKLRGDMVKFAGTAYSSYCLYSDVSSYLDKSNHRHSSLAFLDQTARGINIAASTLDLAGVKMVKPLAIGGGLVKDAVGGNAFADWANQQDNIVLDFADAVADDVNETAFNFFYQAILLFDLYFRGQIYDEYGRPPFGTNVYKPNIYLYPKQPMAVTVEFDLPALLTETLPEYGDRWQVMVWPDGRLAVGGDHAGNSGQNYDYLFYESISNPALFSYEQGWLLPADLAGREKELRRILALYGFNERETADFLDYWLIKLPDGKTYYAYPQPTEVVDQIMPMTITPCPDNVCRLWFVFLAVDHEKLTEKALHSPVTPPVVEAINRDGFHVVEWGGVVG
jgi:hypothetical protein